MITRDLAEEKAKEILAAEIGETTDAAIDLPEEKNGVIPKMQGRKKTISKKIRKPIIVTEKKALKITKNQQNNPRRA